MSSSAPSTRAPDVRAALGLDELHGDAQAVAGLLHAALQQIGDAQLLADLAHVGRAALVGECRSARDDEKRADAGQRRGDRLDDAVGEIILPRLRRHVVERQHGDRRFVGQRQDLNCVASGRIRRASPQADVHARIGLGDVF